MMNNKKSMIIVSITTSFITTFMGSSLNLSIPAMEKDLNVSGANIGWIITIYMLCCGALAVPFGKLAEIYRKEKILFIGIVGFGLSSIACSFSNQLWVLLLMRFFQGIGAAMIFSTNLSVLVENNHGKNIGVNVGYVTCANYLGLSLGPVLGGTINHLLNWRWIFAINGIFMLIPGIIMIFLLKNSTSSSQEKANSQSLSSFFKPLIDFKKIKNLKIVILSLIAIVISYGGCFGVSYLISIFLQVIKGFNSQISGLIMMSSTLTMAISSFIIGKAIKTRRALMTYIIGFFVCTLVFGIYGVISARLTLYWLVISLLFIGIGQGIFSSSNAHWIIAQVDKGGYSIITALISTMRSIGHSLVMMAISGISYFTIGKKSIGDLSEKQLENIINYTFILLFIICILWIIVAVKEKMWYYKE